MYFAPLIAQRTTPDLHGWQLHVHKVEVNWECPLSSQTRSVAAGANPLPEIAVRDKKINYINSLRDRKV